ncbi:granzyme B(G,H)-like [Mugil cephalus]|uniref:granzyme B(G,H)-like n=1 Tax=Mugil cephalus TaxID=48193 RepID=UPI001FB67433|nr:granzyme B(G,H)-like [Mugil cephalus]
MSIHCVLGALMLVLTFDGQVHSGEIIGGHQAVKHSRPYMVLLVTHQPNHPTGYCGGFLLNKKFVMTAAHCQAESYDVLLGLHDFSNPQGIQNVSVGKRFPHPEYDDKVLTNDIMLLKLSSKVKFNRKVKRILLTDKDDATPKSCIVCGWGQTARNNGYMSRILMEVNVTLTAECAEHHAYCSEGDAGPGTGDSGGPLFCNGKAYGVVSASIMHRDKPVYKYTKIPDYRDWINITMKQNSEP